MQTLQGENRFPREYIFYTATAELFFPAAHCKKNPFWVLVRCYSHSCRDKTESCDTLSCNVRRLREKRRTSSGEVRQTDEGQEEEESLPVSCVKKLHKGHKTHTGDSRTHNTDSESSLMKLNLGVKHSLLVLL